jgi:hypothetical protein
VDNRFLEYLDRLGTTNVMRNTIAERIEASTRINPEPFDRIFVSEYATTEGQRIFESLWLFTQNFATESHTLSGERSADVVVLTNNVARLAMKWDDFNFEAPVPGSRLSLNFQLTDGMTGTLKASGENCKDLLEVLTEHLRPNLGR